MPFAMAQPNHCQQPPNENLLFAENSSMADFLLTISPPAYNYQQTTELPSMAKKTPASTFHHQPNSKSANQQHQNCGVCGMPSFGIRCGAIACNACKKFFLRNRDKLGALVCVSGTGDCLIGRVDSPLMATTVAPSSTQYCARCRLAKCFEIGMRIFGRQTVKSADSSGSSDNKPGSRHDSRQQSVSNLSSSSPHSNGSDTIFVDITSSSSMNKKSPNKHQASQGMTTPSTVVVLSKAPIRLECSSVENMLKTILSAGVELCSCQSIPWSVHAPNIPNDSALWQTAMGNFNAVVDIGSSYIKQLPGYSDLCVPDRCRLFSRSLVQIVNAIYAMPNNAENRLFGMLTPIRLKYLRYFPCYKVVEDSFMELTSVLNAWNPSFAEFSLFEAMIFFRSGKYLAENNEKLAQLSQSVMQTFEWYVDNKPDAALKKHYFELALSLCEKFEDNFEVASVKLMYERPDLAHWNQIFTSMYRVTSNVECQQQSELLQLSALN